VPQLCIENFSTLTDYRVYSECFEAGIGTWCVGRLRADAATARGASLCAIAPCVGKPDRRRLFVFPKGNDGGADTHLSVFLEAQDAMWAPTAECTFTLINQADASRSLLYGQSQ
jgi:hypothetical protein